jgi:acyl dehydratase
VRLEQALGDVEAILVERHRRLDQTRVPLRWNLGRHEANLARAHLSRQAEAAAMRSAMIYFEDLEVGAERDFGTYEVTREEVLEFAGKYDPQPFHLSDEAAAKTHFGRIAASGWHTAAMTMAVIARAVVGDEQAGLGSPGIDELRWLKPVYPGDTLHVRGEILDKRESLSKPDIGSYRTKTTVTNQDGVTVMTFVSIVLIRRRPAEG